MQDGSYGDSMLHRVAGGIFARVFKTEDGEVAGKAYAEFYQKFKKAYLHRFDELARESSDYRYDEILGDDDKSTPPGEEGATERKAQTGQNPHSPDEFDDGRSF
ncbi:hypothetical protein J7K50_07815 [bacterium]|nr:hypothetical protein [bacterium]